MDFSNKKIITITGGPGTGKSTIIDGLIAQGFCCYPEISRLLMLEAKKNGVNQLVLEKPLLFSNLLLEARKNQFKSALDQKQPFVFIDRGIPDILAYLNFVGQEFPDLFYEACNQHIYSKVFILPPWKEIYVNDEVRYENFEQSELIYEYLIKTYKNLGYNPIEVPTNEVCNRIKFILDHIAVDN